MVISSTITVIIVMVTVRIKEIMPSRSMMDHLAMVIPNILITSRTISDVSTFIRANFATTGNTKVVTSTVDHD